MAVAFQQGSNSIQPLDSASTINPNLHFSVSEALAESKLLERVREFRRLSFDVASVNSELSDHELSNRAQIMLELKKSAEQFNTLLSPIDAVHRQVLQELKLEQILSRYYWHTLFLANNHPEQGKYELDSLCSKLLNAKYSLSVVGFDIVNSAVEIDADVYAKTDEQRLTTTVLPTISPEILSAVSPNATTEITAHESGDLTIPETPSKTAQPKSYSGAISGLVTGVSALLLAVLAVSVFVPEFLTTMQTLVPVGSIPYRLIMLVCLVTLTTSFYIMLNKLTNRKAVDAAKVVNEDLQSVEKSDLMSTLFEKGVSKRRIIAGVIAPILLGLGLGVATSSGFGSFGFALLLEGLNKVLFAPFWLLLPIITISCCIVAWLFGRVPLGFGTLSTFLLVGPAIGVGAGFAPESVTFNGNVLALVLGLFLFAGGISLAAAAAQGPDGLTALSLAAERTHNWPIPLSIFLWDLTAIAAGVILGGTVGVATVLALFTAPLIILMFLPPFRTVLK